MSFWPLCCKNPQAHAIYLTGYLNSLRGQFCQKYLELQPGGRSHHAESLHVAGARSGRVVTNPVKFKSICDDGGVAEDGKLYVWSGDAAEAARYRNFAEPVTPRSFEERFFRLAMNEGRDVYVFSETVFGLPSLNLIDQFSVTGFSGLFQIGDDEDWKSVTSSRGRLLAIKNDGSLWSLGSWQSGVYAMQGDIFGRSIHAPAWRAMLDSPIISVQTEFTDTTYGIALPVWFTAAPAALPQLQKLRWTRKNIILDELTVAADEPGQGARVSAKFRAKIDDGCIRGITIDSGGSGYADGATILVKVKGHEDSGSGAVVYAAADSSRAIVKIVVINPGEGYRHPVVVTVDGNATLSALEPRQLAITDQGSGYKSVPSVVVTARAGDQSDDALAGAAFAEVSEMSRCGVGEFRVVSGGKDYTSAVARESRTGASATAAVDQYGQIVGWTLNNPGQSLYSPLDDEPLVVEITGDGEGAEATAVPAGCRILELKLVNNPEVWTLPPEVEIVGGGGSGAKVAAEGILGRVSASVDEGGTGYTRTDIRGFVARSAYAPCITMPSQAVVGGRRVGGEVVVGVATLAPSQISQVKEDAREFVNPHRSPYYEYGDAGYTEPEKTLGRHRHAASLLTIATEGVVNPFVEEISIAGFATPNGIDDESIEKYVDEQLRFYLRGPGHERHPLNASYIKGSDADGAPRVKVSLASPLAMSQPPLLCFEVHARPHLRQKIVKDYPFFFNPNDPEQACYRPVLEDGEALADAPVWYADKTRGTTESADEAYYDSAGGGVVTATGESGSKQFYQVVDGALIPVNSESAIGPTLPPPGIGGGSVSNLVPYTGPLQEFAISDPALAWSQPSDAQRVHFVFRTGDDFPARAIAEVTYSAELKHPVVGAVTVVENGKYSEEPEPLLLLNSDLVPRRVSGLVGCTSAGFDSESGNYAYADGKLFWWGGRTSIKSSYQFDPYVPPVYEDGDDLAEVYKETLKTIAEKIPNFTARPTMTGGSLRFASSDGTVARFGRGTLSTGPQAYLRAPRPDYGNDVAIMEAVFIRREGDAVFSGYYFAPGEQDPSKNLVRYRPHDLSSMDHGMGYASHTSLEYRGPGAAPHTVVITASVAGHDIIHVGKNGLFRDTAGKWRVPPLQRYSIAAESHGSEWHALMKLQDMTVKVNNYRVPIPCGFGLPDEFAGFAQNFFVTKGNAREQKHIVAAIRAAGQQYRQASPPGVIDNWAAAGGGAGTLEVTHTGKRSLVLTSGEGGDTYMWLPQTPTPPPSKNRANTSSYGGFHYPLVFRTIGDSAASLAATVVGGGQGATVEVFESPEQRFRPFGLFCLNELSQTIEPAAPLAAAVDGSLVYVYDGIAFSPEAFEDFQPVAGIVHSSGSPRLPYLDERESSHIVRDINGLLWTIASGFSPNDSGLSRRGAFLLPHAGSPSAPVSVSPVAVAMTAPGEGYDYPLSVTASRPPGVASGTVRIDGKMVSIAVVEGGSGYETAPELVITGGGAQGKATIAGPVWKIDVTSSGSDYRQPPRVKFSRPGLAAEAVSTLDDQGRVKSVKVLSGGSYYRQPPTVAFEPIIDIESISVSSGGGAGYSERPSVTIAGGGGSGASGEATISCEVSAINMISGGSGYMTAPTVEVIGGGGGGASARAVLDSGSGTIVRIEIMNGGTGYTTPPSVRVVSTGTGGGAQAIAEIKGFVSSIGLTSRGMNYVSPPKVIITGGGGTGAVATAILGGTGSGAVATARLNGAVVSVEVTAEGLDYQRPPRVTCPSPPPVEGLAQSGAVVKATIVGRPTSVSVTQGGSGYSPPWYSKTESPGESRLRTPSQFVRRPAVYAKGSFFSRVAYNQNHDSTNNEDLAARGPVSVTKIYSPRFQGCWYNLRLLGIAEVAGATADSMGSVSNVLLPKVVVRLRVTSPGSGYPPNSTVDVKFKRGGVRDKKFRLFYDNEHSRGGWDNVNNNSLWAGPDSMQEVYIRPDDNEVVASAYTNELGEVVGVGDSYRSLFHGSNSLPVGITPYTTPPVFEVATRPNQPGSGATVVGELDHPLECYYAPQVFFDGDIEMEADMALTLAGVGVESSKPPKPLTSACVGGGPERPTLGAMRIKPFLNRSKLLQSHVPFNFYATPEGSPPDVRLVVSGAVVGISPLTRLDTWEDSETEFFSAPAGFYDRDDPPRVFFEDQDGTGASVAPAQLPSSGAISVRWVGDCSLASGRGGSGYSLGARVRLAGGTPLAWSNAATGAATIGEGGKIHSIAIQSRGAGYTRTPLVFIVGDGTGATAEVPRTAISKADGSISSLRLLSKGSGYTSATVVIVDREVVAEKSDLVKTVCEFLDSKYSVVLEDCTIARAFIAPESRRQRTTVSVANVQDSVELGPKDSVPAEFGSPIANELEGQGYRLHPAYLSDGFAEYVRLEHHYGQLPPDPPTVYMAANSDVSPTKLASAVAVIPQCDNVFSASAANVTRGGADFKPYQLD